MFTPRVFTLSPFARKEAHKPSEKKTGLNKFNVTPRLWIRLGIICSGDGLGSGPLTKHVEKKRGAGKRKGGGERVGLVARNCLVLLLPVRATLTVFVLSSTFWYGVVPEAQSVDSADHFRRDLVTFKDSILALLTSRYFLKFLAPYILPFSSAFLLTLYPYAETLQCLLRNPLSGTGLSNPVCGVGRPNPQGIWSPLTTGARTVNVFRSFNLSFNSSYRFYSKLFLVAIFRIREQRWIKWCIIFLIRFTLSRHVFWAIRTVFWSPPASFLSPCSFLFSFMRSVER